MITKSLALGLHSGKSSIKILLLLILSGMSVSGQALMPDSSSDRKTVMTFLQKHCISCHGEKVQKAKLRLDQLEFRFDDLRKVKIWEEVTASLNNNQMPPEDEDQPPFALKNQVLNTLENALAEGEIQRRSHESVMRRLNRTEYQNTLRDLFALEFLPPNEFPEDGSAGGFDNNGQALTISPLQIELYYKNASAVLDRALFSGERPPVIQWFFEPEENNLGPDRLRVKRGQNNILLNNNHETNRTEGTYTIVHHEAWNTEVGFRDFAVEHEGVYHLKIRAAGVTPPKEEFIRSVDQILKQRLANSMRENPQGERWHREAYERDLEHFKTHRMYDFGPPRMIVTLTLNGIPQTLAEIDVSDSPNRPGTYTIPCYLTTHRAGISVRYAYDIPRSLENFWMQENPEFKRPLLYLDQFELTGPIHADWPPPSHQKILGKDFPAQEQEIPRLRQILQHFMAKAYRRPATPQEIEEKVALFQQWRDDLPNFVEAVKIPLTAVLTSPHFLFLTESSSGENSKPTRLSGYELATRLAYFLWSSTPDSELLSLGHRGELQKPEVMRAQTLRMLNDPKSEAFIQNFTGQWLGLRKVGSNPPVPNLYPEYDRHLETSIIRESEIFFETILREKLDARNLIQSDFVTINERLARFYGIPNVRGDHFRKVKVPTGIQRGGLITQASILSLTSNGTRTSPVIRGTWILKNLLGMNPGLPVANVGEIANKVPGIDKATVRQRLLLHREADSCARCHDKIDPLGLALENFNAAGEWRDREGFGYEGRIEANDPLIDASATMPDGTMIDGVIGLQKALLQQEDRFLETLASQLTTYALGRELGYSDKAFIKHAVSAMKKQQYTLESLILEIVTSETFFRK